jgi:hypothetical protein
LFKNTRRALANWHEQWASSQVSHGRWGESITCGWACFWFNFCFIMCDCCIDL